MKKIILSLMFVSFQGLFAAAYVPATPIFGPSAPRAIRHIYEGRALCGGLSAVFFQSHLSLRSGLWVERYDVIRAASGQEIEVFLKKHLNFEGIVFCLGEKRVTSLEEVLDEIKKGHRGEIEIKILKKRAGSCFTL